MSALTTLQILYSISFHLIPTTHLSQNLFFDHLPYNLNRPALPGDVGERRSLCDHLSLSCTKINWEVHCLFSSDSALTSPNPIVSTVFKFGSNFVRMITGVCLPDSLPQNWTQGQTKADITLLFNSQSV